MNRHDKWTSHPTTTTSIAMNPNTFSFPFYMQHVDNYNSVSTGISIIYVLHFMVRTWLCFANSNNIHNVMP